MPIKVDEKLLIKEAQKTDKFLLNQRMYHRHRIAGAIKKLETRMMGLVKQLETTPDGKLLGLKTNIKQAQAVHKKMLHLFEEEYGAAARKSVSKLDLVSKQIEKSWKNVGESVTFTGIDKKMMSSLKTQSLAQFAKFGNEAQTKIVNAMYSHVIAGSNFELLRQAVRGALLPHKNIKGRSMAQYANQYAFDMTMNFHNTVNMSKADDLGFEHFLYLGDVIKTSRLFCIMRA